MECADGTSHKCFGNKGRDYTGEPDMHAGQAEVYMKAVESFVEDMNTPERARDSCPVYKADKDEWNR